MARWQPPSSLPVRRYERHDGLKNALNDCTPLFHVAIETDPEELPIVAVAFSNDDYAIISEEAGRGYDLQSGEYCWADHPIDFVAVVNGMGMDATRTDTPDEIRTALSNALQSDRPSLVEVPVDPDEP